MNKPRIALATLAMLTAVTLSACDTGTPEAYCSAHPNNVSACG